MEINGEEIKINGVSYVPRDSQSQPSICLDGKKYVIVRTYSAGVFAGYLDSRNGQEVVLLRARRIYYWDGAATLSQMAMDGVSRPQNCRFPCEVNRIELTEAIEIIDTTAKAQKSIQGVKVWES